MELVNIRHISATSDDDYSILGGTVVVSPG